jgi:hypothetical protein
MYIWECMCVYLYFACMCMHCTYLYVYVCIWNIGLCRYIHLHTTYIHILTYAHGGKNTHTHAQYCMPVYVTYCCIHAIHTCIFGYIHEWTCRIADGLATAIESDRSIRSGSNLARPFCYLRCTKHIFVCWNRTLFRGGCGASKMSFRELFQPLVICWRKGRMHSKLAQFVSHGRLLNLFFGSSQTGDWLPRYGHFKFRVVWRSKTEFTHGLRAVVYVPTTWTKFSLGLHALKQHVNFVYTKCKPTNFLRM